MSKSADLRQAMSASAKSAASPTVAKRVKADTKPEDNPHYRPGRAAMSNVTGYFPPEVKKQLRMLAAEKDTTIQGLLAEALNGLFAAHGKPEIAPLSDN